MNFDCELWSAQSASEYKLPELGAQCVRDRIASYTQNTRSIQCTQHTQTVIYNCEMHLRCPKTNGHIAQMANSWCTLSLSLTLSLSFSYSISLSYSLSLLFSAAAAICSFIPHSSRPASYMLYAKSFFLAEKFRDEKRRQRQLS